LPRPNFSGTDQFTYQASDGALTSNIATVTIAVTAVNNAPVANDDTYITIEDVSLVATAPGVLANDTDGDTFTAIWVGGPAHGTLLLSSNGSFTYAPNPNFSGIDQFTYQASDGALTSNIATVTITVTAANDPPVATPDAYTTMEDSALNVGALGVLANDTDVDGDPLTAVLVSGPAHGTLTLNPDGSFTYTPAHNFSGTDQFAYRAIDAEGVFASAQVTITVTAVNNAPVATDDAYITTEDVSLAVKAPGVLGNDTDTDGDTLTAALVSGPAHGTLTLNANGSFTYTPTSNFSGTDQVTYQASDGALTSNIATVSIAVSAVNDPPVALADGPFLGNAGRSVQMDASASSDSEGAALTFRWNFGDGSTLVTPQAPIEHTYASGGTFPVTLIVNDGQLDSAPFTTQASIGITGGGQQDEVDEFLTYVSPTKKSTDLPAGTTSFSVVIIYGPTILSSTFQASLNGEPFGGFDPRAGTSETVTIPLASGRNVLALQVVGVRADGRQATDRDQLTFNIP
jgi:large repetitive protein